MSRTRIVKGLYNKITHGDHSMFSKENINSFASLVNEKGEDEGVQYGDPKNPPAPELKAKCMVRFRPGEKYIGQYGFDWIRISDTNLSGDTPYKNIICNKSGAHPDASEFALLKNRFEKIAIKDKNITYIVPELNLYPGFEAQLVLYIDIEQKPEKIILKWDKNYLDLRGKNEIKNLSVTSVGKPHKEYLTVYAKEASSNINYIRAYAVDKNNVEHLVGKLKILPNKTVYKFPVVFVGVTTNLSGVKGNSKTGNYLGEYKNLFTLYRQALVKPNLNYVQKFDVSGDAEVLSYKTAGGIAYEKQAGTTKNFLHYRLEALFNAKYPQYNNFYKVFFLADASPGTAGVALLNTRLTIVFTPRNPATTVHELLHAVGLPHSWEKENKNTDINGFVFEKKQTDNVMDYSKTRYSLWKWQWKKLQNKSTSHQYKP